MHDSLPHTRSALVALLRSSLGDAKAEEAVATAADALGISTDSLGHDQALAVLERIAETPGIVGITARFAKARLCGQQRPTVRAIPALRPQTPPRAQPAQRAPPANQPQPLAPTPTPSSLADTQPQPRPPPLDPPSEPAAAGVAASVPSTHSRAELASLFRGSLGNEKASEVIDGAASALGLEGDVFDPRQTLRILDWLARMQGLVGIAARFAKTRVLLAARKDA